MTKKFSLIVVEVLVPLLVLIFWYAGSANSKSFYFPPLADIISRFNDIWFGKGFAENAVPSLIRMSAGYGIAVVFGVIAGVALGVSALARKLIGPAVEFLRAVPSVVLIPFGIVVFGVGDTMKVFIIALGCCFPIILNTADGVRGVDATLIDVSRTFKFTKAERLRRVLLPSASPQIFAGLRTSLSLALILMVVSEMLASTNGIGYSILQAQRLFAITDMWSGIVLLGILGYVINLFLVIIEKWLLAWHRGYRASMLGQNVKTKVQKPRSHAPSNA